MTSPSITLDLHNRAQARKPRISIVSSCFAYGQRHERWACRRIPWQSDPIPYIGYGNSPKAAYEAWKVLNWRELQA
jgi:hypothetical protein